MNWELAINLGMGVWVIGLALGPDCIYGAVITWGKKE